MRDIGKLLVYIYVYLQFNAIPWNELISSMELHAILWKDRVHSWIYTNNSMEEHYYFNESNTVIPWNEYINSISSLLNRSTLCFQVSCLRRESCLKKQVSRLKIQ